MAKNVEDPEALKKYIHELREILENEVILDSKKINNLKDKYQLTVSDIEKINNLAEESFSKATEAFEYGEWDKALTLIEEALFKSPLNTDFLKLYFKIVTESRKLLGVQSKDQVNLELILKRIQKLNTKMYKELKKEQLILKNKISKKWLLLLLVLIPIFILFIPIKKTESSNLTNTYVSKLPPGEILVYKNILRHTSQLKIDVLESKVKSSNSSFIYNLNFYVFSEVENIIKIEGNIEIYDKNNIVLYKSDIESPNGIEYFKNEKIPFKITLNSFRDSPNFGNVKININSIQSSKGQDREDKKKIQLLLPLNKNWKIDLQENLFLRTKGVTKEYLTIDFIFFNNSKYKIKKMTGYFEWMDEYNIVKESVFLTLIDYTDLPVEQNSKRITKKTFEIKNITDNYRFRIEELE